VDLQFLLVGKISDNFIPKIQKLVLKILHIEKFWDKIKILTLLSTHNALCRKLQHLAPFFLTHGAAAHEIQTKSRSCFVIHHSEMRDVSA